MHARVLVRCLPTYADPLVSVSSYKLSCLTVVHVIAPACRPIVVYRSCLHTPGRVDPEQYNRYVIKTLEQGRVDYGLGYKVQAAVVVDRVGSGLKNQDPALLRVLLPCFTTHFPGVIGNIYIAPVNNSFYAIWSLVSLLLDPDTRACVKLLKKESKTEQLLEDMDASVLPKNLGGQLAVPQAGIL
jgi:hypothetical protein